MGGGADICGWGNRFWIKGPFNYFSETLPVALHYFGISKLAACSATGGAREVFGEWSGDERESYTRLGHLPQH